MSAKHEKDVLAIEGLKSGEKHVLQLLAWHANPDNGLTFPSMETLTKESGFKERWVMYLVHLLKRRGLIEAVEFEKGGRGHSVRYRLTERAHSSASFEEVQDVKKILTDPKRQSRRKGALKRKGRTLRQKRAHLSAPDSKDRQDREKGPARRRRPKVTPRDSNGRLMSGVLWSKKDVEARIQRIMRTETYMGLPLTREHAERIAAACQQPGAF